jgi:acylphosphatase
MAKARLHAVVHGRVQGVFFRANTQETAEKLSLTGWVRNAHDGSVELVAEGEKKDLKELLAWCKEGPSAANVYKVEKEWGEPTGEFEEFEIRYD